MNFTKKYLTKSIKLATLCYILMGATHLSYASLYDEFTQSPSAVSTITHTDRVIAVLDVNREQTARTPEDIGETRLAVMMEQAAAQSVLDTSRSIISYTQDTTPGIGLSRSSTCEAMTEHKTHVKRHDLSTQVRHAIAKSKAATYYQNEGNKRQLRALDHYANYCDLSEAKYGNCLPAPNAKGGMNVSYGNIANNMTLTEDQINAGYSYVNNVIDPSKTDLSKCKTSVCNALKMEEAQYHAVGSAIQNALLQQMQDSIAYDEPPGGIRTITVEQLGELSAPWDGNLVAWDEAASGNLITPNLSNLPDDIDKLKKLLLETVSKAESSHSANGWNASNNGTIDNRIVCGRASGGVFNLTSMTVGQVLALQNRRTRPTNINDCSGLFAAGKYQIIPETLAEAVRARKLNHNVLFNEATQRYLAEYLIERRISNFLAGKQSLTDAKLRLAQEWASLGIPSNPGQSYFGKGNKANKQVTLEVWQILEKIHQLNQAKHQQ